MQAKPTYTAVINQATRDFLNDLTAKERAAVTRQIELLEQFGPQLGYPHVRHIKDKTWEIRIRCNKKIFRLYYIIDSNRQIQINYGFHKTSNHLPKQNKKLALKRTRRK
jgi:phage-related protein